MKKTHIILGADHGGYKTKEFLKDFLKSEGHTYEDLGTYSSESVDYPEYGKKVAIAVMNTPDSLGIVLCGTGIGISIAANKEKGVRCALCTSATHARLTRQHNNANILALGGRMTGEEVVKDIVRTFLNTDVNTDFEGSRHERRVQQLES